MAVFGLCHYCIHWAIYASHTAIWQVTHQKQLYPSLPLEVWALSTGATPGDNIKVSNISKAIMGEPPSRSIVLYRDEAPFNRKSIVNSYSICVWTEEKPQARVEQDHKQKFCANIWCDICDFPVGFMYFLHLWQTCKQGLSGEITAWIDGGCAIKLGPKYMVRAPRCYT
jgi:hypothetical protein